jgi:hypothetical protein
MQSEAGKGSATRKTSDQKTYAENWDKIFGRGKIPPKNEHLDELVRLSEELGLYDTEPPTPS